MIKLELDVKQAASVRCACSKSRKITLLILPAVLNGLLTSVI